MSEFSVKKATLFRAGIGWLSADAEIEGDTIFFPVASNSLDDFLKTSLVGIQGGKAAIKNLSFETKGVSKNLFSYSNVIFGMISFLRGSLVQIIYDEDKQIEGRILGYQEMSGIKDTIFVSILTSENVINQINIVQIKQILPQSEKDSSQLSEFLAAVANESDDQHQTLLRIQLTKEGSYTVRVSFLSEVPAWKLTYRILLHNDNSITLESYGIVDNNTLVDWIDAKLTLSTKTPTSFKYDLSTPHLKNRQRINRESKPELEIATPSPTSRSFGARKRGKGLRQESMVYNEMLDDDFQVANVEPDFNTYFEAQSTGDAGESIEYILNNPVTIKRKQSSMVPLASTKFEGRKKLYYNKNNHASHPYFVIEFTNTLEHALESGPLSVHEIQKGNHEFMGETMMHRIGINQDVLLSYALEKNVRIEVRQGNKDYLDRIAIEKLSKLEILSQLRTVTFIVENLSKEDAEVYIGIPKENFQPIDKKFKTFTQTLEFKEAKDEFRVIITIPAQQKKTYKFYLIKEIQRTQYLYYLSSKELEELLNNSDLSDADKDIINTVYSINTELNDLEIKQSNVQQKHDRATGRRKQIIETLKVLDKDAEEDTRRKYISEIEDVDNSINIFLKKIEKLENKINELREIQSDYKQININKVKWNKNIKQKSKKKGTK